MLRGSLLRFEAKKFVAMPTLVWRVRKDRDDADLSSFGANELNAAFDAAKVKAVETVGRQHSCETAKDGYI